MQTVKITAKRKKQGIPLLYPPPMKNITGKVMRKTVMAVRV